MPRDEWKRANNRAKYGPAPYAKPKRKKSRRRKKPLTKRFTPGTDPCPKCGSYDFNEAEGIVAGRKRASRHSWPTPIKATRVTCKKCNKLLAWIPIKKTNTNS